MKNASLRLSKHVETHTVWLFININFCAENHHGGELKYFKDMAAFIKKTIEEDEKGTSGWHVIVGNIQFFNFDY